MNESNPCPRCGSEIAADAPQGLCPKCLMANAIETESPEAQYVPTVTADPKATRPSRVNLGSLEGDIPAAPEPEGKYSIRSEYGKGGMGRVLLVHDEHLGRDIALKELLPDLGDGSTPTPARHSKEMAARFLREAKITGQLEHPSITPVHEIGRKADGTLYYTMKLVRGRTLSQAIKSAKDFEERLKLLPHFVDLCNAIAYAHSRGVIHRDIKPSNVMIGDYGETVIIDWGLAKVKSARDASYPPATPGQKTVLGMRTNTKLDDDSGKTQHGQAMGTPAYMPPEQATGDLDNIDERSDIYSLGAVLFEILTGQPPVEGLNIAHVIRQVIAGKVRKARDIEPKCPKELEAIAMKAMAVEPGDRYQSAKELGDVVEKWKPKLRRSKAVRFAELTTLSVLVCLSVLVLALNVFMDRALQSRLKQLDVMGLLIDYDDVISLRNSDSAADPQAAKLEVCPQDRLLALKSEEPLLRLQEFYDLNHPLAKHLSLFYDDLKRGVTPELREELTDAKELLDDLRLVSNLPPLTTGQVLRFGEVDARRLQVNGLVVYIPVDLILADAYVFGASDGENNLVNAISTTTKLLHHVLDVPGVGQTMAGFRGAGHLALRVRQLYAEGLLSVEETSRALLELETLLRVDTLTLTRRMARQEFLWLFQEIENGNITGALRDKKLYPETRLERTAVKLLGSPAFSFYRKQDMLKLLGLFEKVAEHEKLSYSVFRKEVLTSTSSKSSGWLLAPMTTYFKDLYLNDYAMILYAELEAHLALMRAGLAVDAYKAARGSYPESLEELVPAYLESVPKDPMGDFVIYEQNDTSYTVRSVGRDGVDDGGVKKEVIDQQGRAKWLITDDISWRR